MKSLFAVAALCSALFFTGCESTQMPSSWREKINGPTYRNEVFSADRALVFAAAKAAVLDMGFTVSKAGAAQGIIEGYHKVVAGDSLQSATQRLVSVRVSDDPGGTQVEVLFSQVVQDDFSKGPLLGTTTPMRDTPLYEVFYRGIRESLAGAAKAP